MIYTITFNPALDYIVSVSDFKLGMTNRTDSEEMLAGGKGINVSLVLKNLGYDSTALGFIAGFTGEEIRKRVEMQGCKADFIMVPQGQSRINVKLKNVDGTEINAAGPEIDEESFRKLMMQLNKLQAGDVLVLAGSIPKSLPGSTYRDIMKTLQEKEILYVVDATGDLLVESLAYKPFLIKPNHHEIGEIFGVKLDTREEVIPYAKKMQEMGAANVLVSMSGKGAVQTEKAPDLTVSIQALGQMAAGAVSLFEAMYRPDVTVSGNEAVLEKVFVRKPILVEDHF